MKKLLGWPRLRAGERIVRGRREQMLQLQTGQVAKPSGTGNDLLVSRKDNVCFALPNALARGFPSTNLAGTARE